MLNDQYTLQVWNGDVLLLEQNMVHEATRTFKLEFSTDLNGITVTSIDAGIGTLHIPAGVAGIGFSFFKTEQEAAE